MEAENKKLLDRNHSLSVDVNRDSQQNSPTRSSNLEFKLEAALEENIALSNENDDLKAELETCEKKYNAKIEELKKDLEEKTKIIDRLIMHRDFLLKNAYSVKDERLNENELKVLENKHNDVQLPLNKKEDIPNIFLESFSRSFFTMPQEKLSKTLSKKEITRDKPNEESGMTRHMTQKMFFEESMTDYIVRQIKEEKKEAPKKSYTGYESNDENEEREFLKEKINMEVENILLNRRDFILATLTQENYHFEIKQTKRDDRKVLETIDELLHRVRMKKEKMMEQQKGTGKKK